MVDLHQPLMVAILLAGAAAVVAAAVTDLLHRTISNRTCIVIFLCGVMFHLVAGGLIFGCLAVACVFALCFFAWMGGVLGGGDVKLLAAVSMLLPPVMVPGLLLTTALCGGILAVLYLGMSRLLASRPPATHTETFLSRALRVERMRIAERESIPYGVAIAVAALTAIGHG